MKLQKIRKILILFICFALPLIIGGLFFNNKEVTVYAYEETIETQENLNEPELYNSVTYQKYTKGMTQVNLMFNFVNYKNDNANNFTGNEIQTTITNFSKELNDYFGVMSQGFLDIEVDYVVTTSNNSYDYYLNLNDANYLTEIGLFDNSVNYGLDYNGAKKQFKFNTYNIRVNAFAGNSGEWDTFLWPHSYVGYDLILMMEYKQGAEMVSSTLCHELIHSFGMFDLYAYTGNSYFSAQYFDMMCTSNKNISTNAYFRNNIGWIDKSDYTDAKTTPIEELDLEDNTQIKLDLYANCTSDYSKTIAYKFGVNESNKEFFMVEFRIRNYSDLKFDSLLPKNAGIVIYRVNPTVQGNQNGNETNPAYYNEVIFMGNSNYEISSYNYSESCMITQGESYGYYGENSSTALVYSGGKGKANLFNGDNSNFVIEVENIGTEYATIIISKSFSNELDSIDMKNVCWNYSSAITYDALLHTVQVLNLPNNVTVVYEDAYSAINVGTYIVNIKFNYDTSKYHLINLNIPMKLEWKINPINIEVQINNKESEYGTELKTLDYTIISGTMAEGETFSDLNIKLRTLATKTSDIGNYSIYGECLNKNYKVNFSYAIYKIIPLKVKIVIGNEKYIYGEEINLNNNNFQIIEPYNISKNNLNVQLSTNATKMSSVGEYEITLSDCNKNYDIEFIKGNLIIEKRKLIVVLNNQESNRYFDFEVKQNDYTVLNGSVVNGDNLNLIVTTDAKWSSWWGEYALTADYDNENYDIEIVDAKITVKISYMDFIIFAGIGLVVISIVTSMIVKFVKKRKLRNNYKNYYNW